MIGFYVNLSRFWFLIKIHMANPIHIIAYQQFIWPILHIKLAKKPKTMMKMERERETEKYGKSNRLQGFAHFYSNTELLF